MPSVLSGFRALPGLRGLHALPAFRSEEVLRLLIEDGSSPAEQARAEAVRRCAACPSEWTDQLDGRMTHELGRLAPRLPTIVGWYVSGLSIDEIGRRVGHFGGRWEAERALQAAARCIAASLNSGRPFPR